MAGAGASWCFVVVLRQLRRGRNKGMNNNLDNVKVSIMSRKPICVSPLPSRSLAAPYTHRQLPPTCFKRRVHRHEVCCEHRVSRYLGSTVELQAPHSARIFNASHDSASHDSAFLELAAQKSIGLSKKKRPAVLCDAFLRSGSPPRFRCLSSGQLGDCT